MRTTLKRWYQCHASKSTWPTGRICVGRRSSDSTKRRFMCVCCEERKKRTTHVKELIEVIRMFISPIFHGKFMAFVDKHMGGWANMLPPMYTEELKVCCSACACNARSSAGHSQCDRYESGRNSTLTRFSELTSTHRDTLSLSPFCGGGEVNSVRTVKTA